MIKPRLLPGLGSISKVIGLVALLLGFGVMLNVEWAQASQAGGKVKVYESLERAPNDAVVGQKYRNTEDNTVYIYNGSVWVPYDKRADEIDYDQVMKDLKKSKEGRK